jgi:DivIVA domain-containing protein
MDLERRTIEKRDFTGARKGYDRDEVDRHLRAIAEAVEALKGAPPHGGVATLAAESVEAIVAAAEASARDIEERAEADARRTRERAEADAAAHVQRSAEVADRLSAQAAGLQQQISGLVDQIAALKAGIEAMGEDVAAPPLEPARVPAPEPDPAPELAPEPEPVALQAVPDPEPEPAAGPAAEIPESARLIALNMALSGTPREETARYLGENYELENQDALLDDVYRKAGG